MPFVEPQNLVDVMIEQPSGIGQQPVGPGLATRGRPPESPEACARAAARAAAAERARVDYLSRWNERMRIAERAVQGE